MVGYHTKSSALILVLVLSLENVMFNAFWMTSNFYMADIQR